MGRNRKPSKKRSAASSTAARLLEQTVFYLDESINSRVLAAAMVAVGAHVRTPKEIAGLGAPDEQWLRLVSRPGWVVLMRDQRVRYRHLELNALTEAGVGAFVFTGGQATAAETAEVVCRLLPKLVNVNSSERKPFLYTFGLSGSLSRIRVRP